MANSQLNKLKSGTKNGTLVTLKLSSNVAGDSDDENNFPHKLLWNNTQVSKLRMFFSNNSSANIKLSKTQLHKIKQSEGFLGSLLGPLLKTGLPVIGNVLKPFAKSILIPLRLTAAAAATDPAIHRKMFGSGTTTLIISNEEINDIMKIIKSLEESSLLIKGVGLNNLPKIKDGAYVINLDGFKSKEAHWIALYVHGNKNAIYFDSFGVEHITKEIQFLFLLLWLVFL